MPYPHLEIYARVIGTSPGFDTRLGVIQNTQPPDDDRFWKRPPDLRRRLYRPGQTTVPTPGADINWRAV